MKSLLIQQPKNTHTNQDGFVPTKIAIEEQIKSTEFKIL